MIHFRPIVHWIARWSLSPRKRGRAMTSEFAALVCRIYRLLIQLLQHRVELIEILVLDMQRAAFAAMVDADVKPERV